MASSNSKIVADAMAAADWASEALGSSGYRADFSIESLREVDRFFDEHSSHGQPKPGGLLAQDLGQRLFGLGSYVGEVIRRKAGGDWKGDDGDPRAEINLAVEVPRGTFWPVQRVMKRFKHGSEDGIHVYGIALTEEP